MVAFRDFFQAAMGYSPFSFQARFAEETDLPALVDIPTGCGKTAMAILGWLWRRRFREDTKVETPRRLVYCLPMRVLVEQTRDVAQEWVDRLVKKDILKPDDVSVHILMGGSVDRDWALWPEADMILIGTQDMLLSRALNRGYASSRARWPVDFGLLNNDCLWVFDEVQLMGNGLATSAQLDAFRKMLWEPFGPCMSVWMSATIEKEALVTVDRPAVQNNSCLALSQDERESPHTIIGKTLHAKKVLRRAELRSDTKGAKLIAERVVAIHNEAGSSLTLVIVNTVRRAQEIYKEIVKAVDPRKSPKGSRPNGPDLLLIHSRFRPPDRANKMERLESPLPERGRIVVSTQVVEAGIDISAKTLFTELAPWPCLVQRFGRCNRRGEYDLSEVFWVEVEGTDIAPYTMDELKKARSQLVALSGQPVTSLSLPRVDAIYRARHVVRRKDLIELFDTTPDLAGNDIDISRYIREIDKHDVQVFWRDMGDNKVPDEVAPAADELCPVPVEEFKGFAKDKKIFRWNFLQSRWEDARPEMFCPGHIYCVDTKNGGYTSEVGWDRKSKMPVDPVRSEITDVNESMDSDELSQNRPCETISEHTDRVCSEIDRLIVELQIQEWAAKALRLAARWHDRGKSHEVFQKAIVIDEHPRGDYAKVKHLSNYERKHFRHELASALAVLEAPNTLIPEDLRNIVAYLVAAHHGKVRLSIRSLPTESPPHEDPTKRFARGIIEGDFLEKTDLGGNVLAPAVRLSLEHMELGLSEDGQPSWIERMVRLRDSFGPFRLAYLEALLRTSDWRASNRSG